MYDDDVMMTSSFWRQNDRYRFQIGPNLRRPSLLNRTRWKVGWPLILLLIDWSLLRNSFNAIFWHSELLRSAKYGRNHRFWWNSGMTSQWRHNDVIFSSNFQKKFLALISNFCRNMKSIGPFLGKLSLFLCFCSLYGISYIFTTSLRQNDRNFLSEHGEEPKLSENMQN